MSARHHRSGADAQATKQRRAAFTLVEIMVVVVILGILATVLVPHVIGRTDQARVTKAKVDLQALATAVDLFKADNSVYPSNELGLTALVEQPPNALKWPQGGYLRGRTHVPKDPWGHPYEYFSPAQNGGPYEIVSYGADGKPGGAGYDADLSTTNLEE